MAESVDMQANYRYHEMVRNRNIDVNIEMKSIIKETMHIRIKSSMQY